ncbi:MAG: glycosyltransferase family 2 protein [Oceanicoccus sp.]
MPPRISIITPCLNAAATIRDTIESVINQDFDDMEYIVIDGGSTDGTLEILQEYPDIIDKVVSEPDQGISDAFNKGIKLASGDYIGIINADDYYEPCAFTNILEVAAANGDPDVIHGSLRYIPVTGNDYLEHPCIERIWNYMSVFHPTMFIHRRAYQKIGDYRMDYRYAMDSEWVHRALAGRLKPVRCSGIISSMRLGGVSHKNLLSSLLEFRRSAITHGASRITANYYFVRQLAIQNLVNIRLVKKLRLRLRATSY